MGRVGKDLGSRACLECNVGFYQAAEGQSACSPCPIGMYSEGRKGTACTPCPASLSTRGAGSPSASSCGCPEGFRLLLPRDSRDSPTCSACPTDMRCPSFGAAIRVKPALGALSDVWV